MARTIWVGMLAAAVSVAVAAQQPVPSADAVVRAGDTRPIHVYIRAGLKSHGEGQHDYPQFIADWSKLLTDKGAIVDGSVHFPTAQELADDVAFVKLAQKHPLLLVPGAGFGAPGYFRIAYCVDQGVIERSLPAWRELAREVGLKAS